MSARTRVPGRITAAGLWLLASTAAASLSYKPPRLNACREIMKAKDFSETFLITSSYSCQNITFPCSAPAFPDTRNCENYYKCDSLTITQCPCDPGETFNVATMSCDSSAAACQCPSPTIAAEPATSTSATQTSARASVVTSTPRATTALAAAAPPAPPSGLLSQAATSSTKAAGSDASSPPADAGPAPVVEAQLPAGGSGAAAGAASVASASPATPTQGHGGGDAAAAAAQPPSQSSADAAASSADSRSEASIVIAAIVCGSAVTVAVIGTAVYLCRTSRFRRTRKDAKLPGLPCGEAGGYTQPGVERHVYYEIDDRAVGSSRSFVYRAQPPPLPTTLPPSALSPCTRCLDGCSAAGCGGPAALQPAFIVGPAAATTAGAKRNFPATNPHYRLGSAELHYGSTSAFVVGGGRMQCSSHSRESSSDCSLYSGGSSSNQSTLESYTDGGSGGDMRAPLNAPPQPPTASASAAAAVAAAAKSAYVSKQVYI